MGATMVEATVRGPAGERQVRLLVDSGATYSLLPQDVWQAIGLQPTRRVATALADGSSVERDVSEAFFILAEGSAHSPVFLGEPGDHALLGVVTLETIGLVLNPFTRRLYPMQMLLA